ncbi:MAG: hypothetical protein LBB47_08040, partial [Spirochaetaceae bacterium]|nr:hypothetical protein [Spirochaetaceae bacterium]
VRISRDEEERARLMSEYKYQVDTQSKLVEAKREGLREGRQEGEKLGELKGRQEGRQEGRLEGRQEGEKLGELKGRQEGLNEGEKKGRLEVARNLKRIGIPAQQIALGTGFSLEEIEKL